MSDIFISYAHLDNEVLPGQTQGWVSAFHDSLRVLLNGKVSPVPGIWRDTKIGGNDLITPAILERLEKISVLVSVLSPRYLDSEWCLREVQTFCELAGRNVGLAVAGKSRVVKVMKYPLPEEKELPEVFSDLEGFRFYDGSDVATEYRLEFGAESMQKFFRKVDELANELALLVRALREHAARAAVERAAPAAPAALAAPAEEATVYLAWATPDLEADRSSIQSDLLQRKKYRVLPDRPPLLRAEDFTEQVRADLERSQLSIHLVGVDYGPVPAGGGGSVAETQFNLAGERAAKDPAFTRLVWMPNSNRTDQVLQRGFLDRLLGSGMTPNTECVEGTLEGLKTIIQDKLSPKPAPVTLQAKDGETPLVYVVYEQEDIGAGRLLEDCAREVGFDVISPKLNVDEGRLSAEHKARLKLCDVVLLCWDQAHDLWPYVKLDEVKKVVGLERPEEFEARAVYVCGEMSEQKERFGTREALAIKNAGRPTAASLAPLVEAVRKAREGRRHERA